MVTMQSTVRNVYAYISQATTTMWGAIINPVQIISLK